MASTRAAHAILRAAVATGLATGLASLGGCQKIECADGTFASGDTCVGFDPSDATAPVTTVTPPGGRSRQPIPALVTLTTDEPARIFYTLDGSEPQADGRGEESPVSLVGIAQGTTLTYFAMDRAGNREPVTSIKFDSDVEPPAAVTGLAIAMSAADATLQWTNPTDADYAGTVIARVADAVDVGPTPGKLYTGPTTLSPSVEIVAVGKQTQLADPARPPGPVRYVAWTFDDLGNYSAPVSIRGAVPLGALTAQYTYNATNNTLTPTQLPASLDLEGTAAALAGTTLTLSLRVKNNSAQYFQNLKAKVTGVTNATFTGADGMADSFPFRAVGPQLVAPGVTVSRDLVFGGVAAGSTVTINLTFAHHASLVCTAGKNNQQQHVIDLGSGLTQPIVVTTSRGPNDRFNGRVRPGTLVGGRYLDIPTSHGTIERWDLITRTQKATARLAEEGQRANVQGIYVGRDATYAVVKYGGRRRNAMAELVRLDEGLSVTGRLDLQLLDGQGFARAAFSADGSTLAIPLLGGVVLVDVKQMALIDATPGTPTSIDPIEPGFTDRIRSVHFFDNDRGLVILSRANGQAAFVRRMADDYTVTPYQDAVTNAKGFSLAAAADGKIWMAFASGIRAFDPATGNVSTISYAAAPNGLSLVDGAMWIVRSDRVNLDQVSLTGAVQRTITLPAGTGAHGHWLDLAR